MIFLQFQRTCANLWQHGDFLIYLFLSLVALWHGLGVVSSYKQDNILTVTSIESINHSLPFLLNTSIQVCVHYEENVIFQDGWSNRNAGNMLMEDESLHNFTYLYENVRKHMNSYNNGTRLPLRDRLSSAVLLSHVQRLDRANFYFTTPLPSPSEVNFSDSMMKLNQYGDILNDGWFMDALHTELWNEFSSSIDQIEYPIDKAVLGAHFHPAAICVFLNLHAMLNREMAYSNLFILNVATSKRSLLKYAPNISLWIASDSNTMNEIELKNGSMAMVDLHVNNLGVIDRKETSKCTGEPPLFPFPGTLGHTGNDCLAKDYLEIIAKECHCVPYSYRWQWHHVRDHSMHPMAYCTPLAYEKCHEMVRSRMQNREDCLPLCMEKKNSYILATNLDKDSPNVCERSGTFCSRAVFTFECKDSAYFIYEERYQQTLQQVVSQIGGEVGLYTGFSFLTVWSALKILCCVYFKYRKYGQASPSQEQDYPAEGNRSSTATRCTRFSSLLHCLKAVISYKKQDDRVEKKAFIAGMDSRIHAIESKIAGISDLLHLMLKKQEMFQFELNQMKWLMHEKQPNISDTHQMNMATEISRRTSMY